jgi:hypothetical protein
MKILSEISVGEAVDKWTILEIKSERIPREATEKITEVENEIKMLVTDELREVRKKYLLVYHLLKYMNEIIWDLTEETKQLDAQFLHDQQDQNRHNGIWESVSTAAKYGQISQEIFTFNERRFRVKKWLNTLTDSSVKEQKSYGEKRAKIYFDQSFLQSYSESPEISHNASVIGLPTSLHPKTRKLYETQDKILKMLLDYDNVIIELPANYNTDDNLRNFFNLVMFYIMNIPSLKIWVSCTESLEEINVNSYRGIGHERMTKNLAYITPNITYCCSGRLGDFIQSLSVVCERYHQTGKRGIVYMIEKDPRFSPQEHDYMRFRNGLENTMADIRPLLMEQEYIEDIRTGDYNKIYDVECNLNIWRLSQVLHNAFIKSALGEPFECPNTIELYSNEFNIEWGKHAWLSAHSTSQEIRDKWKDVVIVNVTDYRWCDDRNNVELAKLAQYDNVIFLSDNQDKYTNFLEKTGLTNVGLFIFSNFRELCDAIAYCKLFIGGLSAPMSIAHALHKPRVVLGSLHQVETVLNSGFDKYPYWEGQVKYCLEDLSRLV